jgi:hypothetical protein
VSDYPPKNGESGPKNNTAELANRKTAKVVPKRDEVTEKWKDVRASKYPGRKKRN